MEYIIPGVKMAVPAPARKKQVLGKISKPKAADVGRDDSPAPDLVL
jgi:hypothetical protein